MVGVPALAWCDCGPSSRTTSPNLCRRRMAAGPMRRAIRSAVSTPHTARRVMYRKTPKPLCSSDSASKSSFSIDRRAPARRSPFPIEREPLDEHGNRRPRPQVRPELVPPARRARGDAAPPDRMREPPRRRGGRRAVQPGDPPNRGRGAPPRREARVSSPPSSGHVSEGEPAFPAAARPARPARPAANPGWRCRCRRGAPNRPRANAGTGRPGTGRIPSSPSRIAASGSPIARPAAVAARAFMTLCRAGKRKLDHRSSIGASRA